MPFSSVRRGDWGGCAACVTVMAAINALVAIVSVVRAVISDSYYQRSPFRCRRQPKDPAGPLMSRIVRFHGGRMTRYLYWGTTALVSLALLGSLSYLTGSEQVVSGFAKAGYPQHLRIVLGVAKPAAAIVLLLPGLP